MCLQGGRGLGGQGLTLRISLEPEARKHEGVPLHCPGWHRPPAGAGWEPGSPIPQHLAVPARAALAGKPPPRPHPGPAPYPAHLPPTSPPAHQSICLSFSLKPSWRTSHSPEDIREGEFPLEPDEQPPEAEAERTRVLGVWSGGQWPGRSNALYQPQSHSNSQGTSVRTGL